MGRYREPDSLSCPRLSGLKQSKCTLEWKLHTIARFKPVLSALTLLNSFTFKLLLYFQELHQHVKAKTTDGFKKKHCSLPATICSTGKCDKNDWDYSGFCQTHFPQIIPFMVDWLRTLLCRFPYLTWGGCAEEWMDVFLAGQQCGE